MFIRRLVLLESEKVAANVTAERLAEIIAKSGSVPIGLITDHFDKNVKRIFSDLSESKLIVHSVLQQTDAQSKLKIPEKIKEYLTGAIVKNLDDLRLDETLRIPHLLRRLPNGIMASDSEDRLLEGFLRKFFLNLTSIPQNEISVVVLDVAKLRLRHPCKNVPIVRFFESIPAILSSNGSLRLLSCVVALKREVLAHAVVRSRCIDLIRCLKNEDLGKVLGVLSRLAVFPEIDIDQISHVNPKSENFSRAEGVASLLSLHCTPEQASICLGKLQNFNQSEFLERIVTLNRINSHVAEVLLENKRIDESLLKTSRDIAGWIRLVATARPADLAQEINKYKTAFLNSEIDRFSAIQMTKYISRCVDSGVSAKDFLSQAVPDSSFSAREISILCENDFPGIEEIACSSKDAEAVAIALSKRNTQGIADRLKVVLKPITDVSILTRICTILSDSGNIHTDPELLMTPRGTMLKLTQKQVFNAVRMAPITI